MIKVLLLCGVAFTSVASAFHPFQKSSKLYDIFTAPYHPSIHNMGNTGPLGYLHASMAWSATRIIDKVAYDGRNVRQEIADSLGSILSRKETRVLEVGCGVGTLTKYLAHNFDDIIAFDTSPVMLNVAKKECSDKIDFRLANGVHCDQFDKNLCISSFVLHELPTAAHTKLVQSMIDCVQSESGEVWLIDIDPSYTPSLSMKSGEPFVLEYLENIDNTIASVSDANAFACDRVQIIPDHVFAWVLTPRAH